MTRPKRLSMGCYFLDIGGRRIVLQRCGRSGFRIIMRPGAISPIFKRLRDAAEIAASAANPWPFDVEKKFDGAADLPPYLDRRTA